MLAVITTAQAAQAAQTTDPLTGEGGEIALAIAVVVAASMALQTALWPAMNGIVEAVKSARLAPDGWGGVFSLGIGTALGLLAGVLAYTQSADGNTIWIGVGAFAGLIGLGAGGVRSHLVTEGLQAQKASQSGDDGQGAGAKVEPEAPAPATAVDRAGQNGEAPPPADRDAGARVEAGAGLSGNGRTRPELSATTEPGR